MGMQAAFLADILANPDDDAPRLVFADWLTDNGDPERADFIRAQCRLATMGRYDLERYDLEGEAEILLAKNAKAWRKPLAKVTARVEFERGFIGRISLDAAKFAKLAEQAFDAAPIRAYRVLQPAVGWDKLLKCPSLARLRSLDLGHHRLAANRAQSLARCAHLSDLRELDLDGAYLRSAIRDLAASPHLGRLRKLGLRGCSLGGAAEQTRAWTELTALDVSRNELTPEDIASLSRRGKAAPLEELAIDEFEAGDDAARAFAGGDWSGLRKLELHLRRMTGDGMAALAGCASLGSLRDLTLWYSTDDRTGALFSSPRLAGLERLHLTPEAGRADLLAIASSPMLPGLRSLRLDGSDPEGLRAVLASPAAAGLRELELASLDGMPCLRRVADAGHLANLRKLTLEHTRIDAEGAGLLANAAHLSGLVELDLSWNGLDAEGAAALAKSPHLGRLRVLTLASFPGQDEGAFAALEERFGSQVVRRG